MNQLKMTFGVEGLNQLGEMIKPKRRIRRQRVQAVESALMDEFLNPEKIEAFLTPNLDVVESIELGAYRCDWRPQRSFPPATSSAISFRCL